MTPIPFLPIAYSPDWDNEIAAQLQQIAADLKCEAVVQRNTPTLEEVAPWDVIPDWQQEAEADHAEWLDEKRTMEDSRF